MDCFFYAFMLYFSKETERRIAMDIKCPLYDKEALNDLLAQLIKVPSIAPPGNEAPCADLLAEYLKDCP